MQHVRLIDRVENYWKSLAADRPMPDARQINPSVIHDIWPKCLLLSLVNKVGQVQLFQYEHMGSDLCKAYGQDLTNQYVNVHMHHFPGWQILQSAEGIIAEPVPKYLSGQFTNDTAKTIKYRSCMMPFSTRGELSHLLVGLSWREF